MRNLIGAQKFLMLKKASKKKSPFASVNFIQKEYDLGPKNLVSSTGFLIVIIV